MAEGEVGSEGSEENLSATEVSQHASRLREAFKDALSQLPQFQEAVVGSFFKPSDRGGNRTSFEKDGFLYHVRAEDNSLIIAKIPEQSKGKGIFEWKRGEGQSGRIVYGEAVHISLPSSDSRATDPRSDIGYESPDVPTSPGYVEHYSVNSRLTLEKIEEFLADLKA